MRDQDDRDDGGLFTRDHESRAKARAAANERRPEVRRPPATGIIEHKRGYGAVSEVAELTGQVFKEGEDGPTIVPALPKSPAKPAKDK